MSVCLQDFLYSLESTMSREVDDRQDRVHTFTIKDTHLAYDGATGTLHRLTPVGKAVICVFESTPSLFEQSLENAQEIASAFLWDKFPQEDIAEAVEEVFELYGKTLYGEDENLPQQRSALEAGLKALCIDIAHDCNLACRYCFAYGGAYGGERSLMSPEMGKSAIDFLVRESKNRRFLDVDFFGGEPMMAFETVKTCVDYARDIEKKTGKIFRFTLTTNCTLLTDEAIEFLNREKVSLILSLDGRKEIHDYMRYHRDKSPSFDLAVKLAKRAVQSRGGKDYFVRGTYTKNNLDFYKDVENLYNNGFRHISLEPAVGEGNWGLTLDDLPAMSRSYEKLVDFWVSCHKAKDPFAFYHFNLGLEGGMCRERRITGCGAGYEYVAVTPTGDIYPCHQLVGEERYKMGDVFTPYCQDKDINKIREQFFASRVPHKFECQRCWARYLCGGGCHSRAIFSTGDITKPDPVSCAFMKLRLEYALYAQYIIST